MDISIAIYGYIERNIWIYRTQYMDIWTQYIDYRTQYMDILNAIYFHCHEKTSYVSNFALSFYCMNGSIEDRCTNYKNSSVCNFDFIARSVLLELFKVMRLLSIGPFMQQSEKRIIWHVGGFFVTTTIWIYRTQYMDISNAIYGYNAIHRCIVAIPAFRKIGTS